MDANTKRLIAIAITGLLYTDDYIDAISQGGEKSMNKERAWENESWKWLDENYDIKDVGLAIFDTMYPQEPAD